MSDLRPADKWPVESPPSVEDVQTLRTRLREFNDDRAAVDRGQQLAIFRRDDTGEMVAGIYGWLWGECLEIDFLWVDERLRGRGVGRRLVLRIEEAAYERGGRHAILDTFSFQAPLFYQRLGYETIAQVEGYGGQHSKYFMRKNLA